MTDQSLALLKEQVPSAETLTQMLAVAKELVDARMVPVGITKAGQALALILTGREMGIGPLRSVQDLYHVKGNVGMMTKFMVAQFRLAGHSHDILIQSAQHSKVKLHLKEGRDVVIELTRQEVDAFGYPYYWKEPERGGPKVKTLKPQWKVNPAGLLYNRNMTQGIRTHAPEVLYGMLTQEEIQDRGVAAGESRLVGFLKERYPDVWTEWAQIQLRQDLLEAAKRDAVDGESREIPPDEDNGQGESGETEPEPAKHWMDKKSKQTGVPLRTTFWVWVGSEKNLTNVDVYEALGTTVEQEFPDIHETKRLIEAYINKRAEAASPPPTQGAFLNEEDIPFG